MASIETITKLSLANIALLDKFNSTISQSLNSFNGKSANEIISDSINTQWFFAHGYEDRTGLLEGLQCEHDAYTNKLSEFFGDPSIHVPQFTDDACIIKNKELKRDFLQNICQLTITEWRTTKLAEAMLNFVAEEIPLQRRKLVNVNIPVYPGGVSGPTSAPTMIEKDEDFFARVLLSLGVSISNITKRDDQEGQNTELGNLSRSVSFVESRKGLP